MSGRGNSGSTGAAESGGPGGQRKARAQDEPTRRGLPENPRPLLSSRRVPSVPRPAPPTPDEAGPHVGWTGEALLQGHVLTLERPGKPVSPKVHF